MQKDSTAIPHAFSNVVVKNVHFCDNGRIFASSCGNSFINNTFEGGGIWIVGNNDGDIGNVIKHNVFINASGGVFVDYTGRANNVVTENNFINSGVQYGLYSGLDVDRNYWSDYAELYSDAKEVGRTGVWDTPHVCVRLHGDYGDPTIFDYHPLVYPVNGVGAPKVDYTTEPGQTVTTDEHKPEFFPTVLIIVLVAVLVIIVSINLLVYFKKRK